METGLSVSCETILDAELSIEVPSKILLLGDGSELTTELTNSNETAIMQFFIPENAEKANINVKSSCADSNCDLSIHVTANDQLFHKKFNTSEFNLKFRPHAGSTHYVTLRLLSGTSSNIVVKMESETVPATALDFPKLTRNTIPEFFFFDYDHISENSTRPIAINLTVGALSVLRFKVGSVYDIGGTLSLGLKIADSEDENRKMVLIGCVTYGNFFTVAYRVRITLRTDCV